MTQSVDELAHLLSMLGSMDTNTISNLKQMADSVNRKPVADRGGLNVYVQQPERSNVPVRDSRDEQLDRLTELVSELANNVSALRHKPAEDSDVMSQLNALRNDMQSSNQSVNELKQASEDCDHLRESYHELENKLHDAEARCDKYKSDVKDLNDKLSLCTRDLEVRTNTLDDCEHQLDDAKKQVLDLKQKVEALDSDDQVETLSSELDGANDKIEELTKLVEKRDQRIDELEKSFEDTDAEATQLSEINKKFVDYIEYLFELISADATFVKECDEFKALPESVRAKLNLGGRKVRLAVIDPDEDEDHGDGRKADDKMLDDAREALQDISIGVNAAPAEDDDDPFKDSENGANNE